MEKREVSWGIVIVLLIFFLPAGLYFLAKKSETNTMAGTLLQIFGWINVIIAVVCFLVMIDPEYATGGEGWFVLFFGIFAVLFIGIGFRNKRRIARCKKLIDYVTVHKIYEIDKIASLENSNFEAVVKDLKFIYNAGYLIQFTYLDIPNRVIVHRNQQNNNQNNGVQIPVANQPTEKTVSVRCSGCGANVKVVVGSVTECEYCGAPINA